MSPRAYDRTLRKAAAEEAKRRIAEAAAGLHAQHGSRGTSHAMIAKAAGVSLPTVYKYFPTPNDLIPACTGAAAAKAPVALDASVFDGLPRVPDRVRALARAVFRLHQYFAPWLRWTDADAESLPALREFLDGGRRHRRDLLRRALAPRGARPPAEPLVLVAHVLLEHPSWKTLTATGKSSDQAAAVVADAVNALVRSHR
ncbi:MAG TPA: TetR/AcrR family transcriptional regulator [Planctomycetota bacterium]|nr:TetR/AcrR family transcriptional regulator [Planctomycetota bacterium]